ncbi:MAG: hypothetical protein A2020_09665 [Lentisphaerae bacterium GWF2_45_14]|nr:MAG: hypothetical protein A2020_09665 [Lentisphaerae bacterium GWF2_45_14]
MNKFKLAGTGCSVGDYLYANVDFTSETFRKYLSHKPGDGGLIPGHLVFLDDLCRFANADYKTISQDLTGAKSPDKFNIGGPAIVSMINAAQLIAHKGISADFRGAAGKDDTAFRIFKILEKTPISAKNFKISDAMTPFTDVLSDPNYNEGKGERTFINNVGAAWDLGPEDIDNSFFDSDVLLFGATALVPKLHDGLTDLLRKGRDAGKFNIVITVFDFRNEMKFPDKRWPLGESDESYKLLDLLIVDHVEALRLSGESNINNAMAFFIKKGVKAFLVTNGAKDISIYSDGTAFRKLDLTSLPISSYVTEELSAHPERKGDTTGCGDNFAGGVIASVCSQLQDSGPRSPIDLVQAAAWGVASGGFACFYIGGTYLEQTPGEKLERVAFYFKNYVEEIKNYYKVRNLEI